VVVQTLPLRPDGMVVALPDLSHVAAAAPPERFDTLVISRDSSERPGPGRGSVMKGIECRVPPLAPRGCPRR